jgi:two-component system cell cycle sensor histidine kinase/response regulator CckA
MIGEIASVLVPAGQMTTTPPLQIAMPSADTLFEETPGGLALLDASGRIVRANRAMRALLEAPDIPAEGREAAQILGPGWRRGEHRLVCAGGGERWVISSTSALHDADGAPAGTLWQLVELRGHDAVASLEEQLRRAQRMEAVGRLAGGVAHDFNNMLSVVLNYADFARKKTTDPKLLPLLDGIRHGADKAAKLTRQLMIVAGREVEKPDVVDLNVVVTELLDLLQRTLGEDVQVRTKLADRPAWVLLAVPHAEQVFMNLAVNARDAMPGGGKLTIGTVVNAEYVELTVSDTGVGMTPEVLRHAFEPFFTTKGPGLGTGLGLSTVYGIVDGAGGSVDVSSAPGRGTTFKIRLPPAQQPAARPVEEPGREAPSGNGERVLVVEDREDVRSVAAQLLAEAGYRVTTVGSGRAALELWQDHGFDIVLTDVVMPGLSGVELGAHLRARGVTAPIVYMSGHVDQRLGDLPEGMFLRKPFNRETLLGVVSGAVRR